MRIFLFSLLLFRCLVNGFGQQYYKMLDSTTVWFQEWSYDAGGTGDGSLDKYFFDGDTLINGYQYFRLHQLSQHFSYGGIYTEYYDIYDATTHIYLREDTIQKQVFSLEISAFDTIENLLYDFDLDIGDTLHFNTDIVTNIVIGKDSILINGVYRKQFSIGCDEAIFDPYLYLIEGVGSTYGLVAHFEPPFETQQVLHCFTQEYETTIFDISAWDDTTEFCEFKVPLEISGDQFQAIILSPNPADKNIIIKNSVNVSQNSAYAIYNLAGILLLSGELSGPDQSDINIEELHPGYYYIILNAENKSWRGSFIKQ